MPTDVAYRCGMQSGTPTNDDTTASDLDFLAIFRTHVGQHAAIRDAIAPTTPEVDCNDASCAAAYSHPDTCECSCGGAGHGIRWKADAERGQAAMATRIARAGGNVFALLPAAPDDEAW